MYLQVHLRRGLVPTVIGRRLPLRQGTLVTNCIWDVLFLSLCSCWFMVVEASMQVPVWRQAWQRTKKGCRVLVRSIHTG